MAWPPNAYQQPIDWQPPLSWQNPVGADAPPISWNPVPQLRPTVQSAATPLAESVAADAASAGGAGGGGGWLSLAKNAFTEGGGIKGALGRTPGAIGLGIAGTVGGQLAGQLGAPRAVSNALSGAGSGAGAGFALAGAPGAIAGGLAGAVMSGLGQDRGQESDLDTAHKLVPALKRFDQVVSSMPKSLQDDAAQLRQQILKASPAEMEKGGGPARVLAALNQGIDQMQAAAKSKATKATSTEHRALQQSVLQMQMANAMHELAGGAVTTGNQLAQSIRAQIPNVSPQMQPILELDALQREAYGRQVQSAYTGAAYAQPQVDRMDAQLAYLAQLNQQRAAQIAALHAAQASGGGSLSQALAQSVAK